MKNGLLLGLILTGYILLSVGFHLASPPLEVADEAGHLEYVLRLGENFSLPRADLADREILGIQELTQPPLYYLASALLILPIDTANNGQFRHFRNGAPVGRADLPGPRNMWHKQGDRSFPYSKTMLAIFVLRCFSAVLGLTTVAVIFKTASVLFPAHTEIAFFAAALAAFNPMFLLIANSINNDNLVSLAVAVGVWLLVAGASFPFSRNRYAWLGVVSAAALLAKPSGLILWPAALLHLAFDRASIAEKGKALAVYLVSAVILSGWWITLNLMRYGEPLALTIHSAMANNARKSPDLFALFRPLEWSGFLKSYWGVFGTFNVIYSDAVYYFFFLLSAVLVLLSLVYFSSRRRSLPPGLPWLAAVALLNFAAVAWWTSRLSGSQGRLLFPSIAAISICLAAGTSLIPPKGRYLLIGAVSMILFILSAYAALVVIPAAYV